MSSTEQSGKAAILIVNSGGGVDGDRGIKRCLSRITTHTVYPNYHIYIWNSGSDDQTLVSWILSEENMTLLSGAGYEVLHHPIRTALQRLYCLAREEGANYIVTMDSCVYPLGEGWLSQLLAALENGAVLAGIWHDATTETSRPYVHPACLCTTVDFVEQHRLRFDFDTTGRGAGDDTLSHFTWVAEAEGVPIHRLRRGSQSNMDGALGGIYGDNLYCDGGPNPPDGIPSARGDDAGEGEAGRAVYRWKRLLSGKFRKGRDPRAWKRLVRGQLQKMPVLDRLLTRLVRRIRHPRSEITLFVSNVLSMKDLAPPPAHGWTIEKPPDFVGIGSPKAGTTWWHTLLLEHPQVVSSRAKRKELHYFVHFQHREMTPVQVALYRQIFPTPPGAVSGEFSPTYLAYPHCIEHLAAVAPEAKIIIILRNPVDRFVSHLNHLKWGPRQKSMARTLSEQQLYVYDTFSCYSEATLHSLYSVGLAHFLRHFDRKQLLVLQFERSILDPAGELARTYRFLGVDDRYVPNQLTAPRNVLPYVIAKPSPQERTRLAAYFADDVARTCELCPEIDLSLWPDFLNLA